MKNGFNVDFIFSRMCRTFLNLRFFKSALFSKANNFVSLFMTGRHEFDRSFTVKRKKIKIYHYFSSVYFI